MNSSYSKIRFIGYAVPTTPAGLVPIGNPNGPGAVAGTYLGNDDPQTDITDRISIVKNAVDTAKAKIGISEPDVINVFVAPEFFFHGTQGPYIYDSPSGDPVDTLKNQLVNTFTADDYPNWIFIFGSAITTILKNVERVYDYNSVKVRNQVVESLSKQWQSAYGPLKDVIFDMLVNFIKNCHAYPNCEVRNRNVILSYLPIAIFNNNHTYANTNLMTTEKYFVSNEDFLLYEVNGKQVITEQMTTYPSIDLSAGDLKYNAFDQYAFFVLNEKIDTWYPGIGVEICLDHSDARLRRNIDNYDKQFIGGIHIQLIPSCGMQIKWPCVATDKNGFVFNCDGQYALSSIGKGQTIINDVDCLFANYNNNGGYAAHTQLAQVNAPATGNDPDSPGSSNATFLKLDEANIDVFPVVPPANFDEYFAGGPGEIHIYGLHNPYTIYP